MKPTAPAPHTDDAGDARLAALLRSQPPAAAPATLAARTLAAARTEAALDSALGAQPAAAAPATLLARVLDEASCRPAPAGLAERVTARAARTAPARGRGQALAVALGGALAAALVAAPPNPGAPLAQSGLGEALRVLGGLPAQLVPPSAWVALAVAAGAAALLSAGLAASLARLGQPSFR